MSIHNIKEKLINSQHPVAEVIHKNTGFKVLAIGFKEGMILKEHKANLPAKLTVLEGAVNYKEGESVTMLNQYDCVDIAVNVIHSVEALSNSLCLLTQG